MHTIGYINRKTSLLLLGILLLLSCQKSETKEFTINNGVNISHWLSQSNKRGEERAKYFSRDDASLLAGLGYDHLRIPIDEEQMFDENGAKDPEAFQLLHNALDWCAELNLRAVVDLHILRSHHFNDEVKPLFTDTLAQNQFYDCWRKLSGELKKYPDSAVAYELMNEPVADEPEIWNVIVNRCISVVRALEPQRTLIIGSNRWQNYNTVKDLRLPANDSHIMISFHYYDPFPLTHYQASWMSLKDLSVPVHYPGKLVAESDEKALNDVGYQNETYNIDVIESHFKQVVEVAKTYNLKVYCGEYGAINAAPYEDKVRWFRDMNILFKRYGIAHANWDYKGSFAIVRDGVPQAEILNAIFGE
ncbi:endoglucanase [Bacteroidia bacterium]|nr:endoglucanase [Bacteroidia bacterium]